MDLNGRMTPHEYMRKLNKIPAQLTPNEVAQFIIYLRDEAYNNELRLSPVTVGYLADIAYGLASPLSQRQWEKTTAAALGQKGGVSTSEAKQRAARLNGRKGGRPKINEQ